MTVPDPIPEFARIGFASKVIDSKIDRATDMVPRVRGIFFSMRAPFRIAGTQNSVNP
jgi:hypothetical protein